MDAELNFKIFYFSKKSPNFVMEVVHVFLGQIPTFQISVAHINF